MRYLGGKAKISKRLVEFLTSRRKPGQIYAEPCIGGGSVIRRLLNPRVANDIHDDLILFYKAICSGWQPPVTVSEDDYRRIKQGSPSALRGFVGFFCSFGGKWWGGFARGDGRDFANEAHRDSLRLAKDLGGTDFYCSDYADFLSMLKHNCLVYVDPPYKNTTKYSGVFDHNRFWEVIRQFSKVHDIYVSEYTAPSDFQCVWSTIRKTELNTKNGKGIRVEKLFQFDGG